MKARWGVVALALAGCPSAQPRPVPTVTAPEPSSAPAPAETSVAFRELPNDAAPPPSAEPDAEVPVRSKYLRQEQLTAANIECSELDEIVVRGYPAGVPDCDSSVKCTLFHPPNAPTAQLASGGEPATCQGKLGQYEYSWRPLPELTRRVRRICEGACCGIAVRGCL